MDHPTLKRRAFLGGTALTVAAFGNTGALAAGSVGATAADGDVFVFEINRTPEEWRARLSRDEFSVLRKGGTELPKSSPLWNKTAEGDYRCKGCELGVYQSVWKVELDKGWAFFSQSRENAVLMGIDGLPPDGTMQSEDGPGAMIEAHCRRCGSHLGHILTVEGSTLHCINGTSLTFLPATA